ncbi:MAG: 1-hydroxycarotenoid 3,4-desaturase CrtD [Ferruginibacter sp.]
MHSRKAVIIGSGIAGIAAAIRLAVAGYHVSVYEKNNYAGGKIAAFEKDGYHFDAGPSLFTQPDNIKELFELAGESITDYITWQAVDISCKYFYENGKVVVAYTDPEKFAEEMKSGLNENPETVIEYLKQSKKLYKNIGQLFLDNSLHKRKTWFHKKIGTAISALKFKHVFNSLHKFNSRQFSSPEAVQLFDRFATYNGSDPYKAPAMLSLIPHLELDHGTFYPTGGLISIVNALYNLAKNKGVEFNFNSPVQRIIQHEGKVRGVVVNNENISADIVVSNADVYFTYKDLLQNKAAANKLLKQERSSSAVIFYWGIRKQFDQLQLHNIFFSDNYKKEFDHIFKIKQLSSDPTIYINISSKMESSLAPPNTENWFVMVNAPANNGQDWNEIRQRLRNTVISKLSGMLGEDIEPLIATERIADPLSIEEETGSYMGSLYGSSSNSKAAAFFRHPNFSDTVKGLYFCGGSVHPGGGIPLCLKSAKIVSELITADHKHSRGH